MSGANIFYRKGAYLMTIDELAARVGRLEDTLAELSAQAEAAYRGPYAKLRETYPNAGKPWSKVDDEELARLFSAGNTQADLALLFGRTHNGVRQRLERLGLIQTAAASA